MNFRFEGVSLSLCETYNFIGTSQAAAARNAFFHQSAGTDVCGTSVGQKVTAVASP
jgi:hypothetical protein